MVDWSTIWPRSGKVRGIARMIWSVNKRGQMYFASRLAASGLGAGQYPPLSLLYAKEGLSQEEMASYLGVDKAAIAKAVRKLLEEGYVERRGDGKDARLRRAWLTPKAKRARARILAIEEDWQAGLLAGFSEEETRALEALLARLEANSGKA
jgi:DNA-binding MarR family transcriptional regulator